MNLVGVLKAKDGSVGVVIPSDNSLSHDAVEIIVQAAMKEEHVSYRIIDKNKLPEDRDFRDAWTDDFDTDTVDIDNCKAKELQLVKLRAERDEALIENDKAYLIAQKNGDEDSLSDLSSKRLELLNVTEELKALNIDCANCPETLAIIKELGTL